MGMTDAQFKAYVATILEEIREYRELSASDSAELRAFANKKLEKLENRLQEVMER